LHIFSIHLSSRHEKRCRMLQTIFWLFQCSRNQRCPGHLKYDMGVVALASELCCCFFWKTINSSNQFTTELENRHRGLHIVRFLCSQGIIPYWMRTDLVLKLRSLLYCSFSRNLKTDLVLKARKIFFPFTKSLFFSYLMLKKGQDCTDFIRFRSKKNVKLKCFFH
jgi:hypothetical protein